MMLGLLMAASLAGAAVTGGVASQRLSPQEQRGKDIYLGVGTASESPIKATVGVPPSEAPAMLLACVNCHGRDGKGKPEGRVVPSDVTWETLTKPYGVTHSDGRTHQPYTERLLVRAICMGLDPAGNQLNAAMPRFQISREDINALILYLKRLAGDGETGISESTIRIGTIVPTTGPFAETGHAVRSVLTAYFDAINKQGGIYNRRLELKVAALGDSPAEAGANVERLMSEEQPFALVGGVTTGAEKEFAAAAERNQVPWVGPLTMPADTGAATNEHTFYLLSGVEQQARALIDYARNSAKDPGASLAIVYSERAIPASMVGPLREYATQAGWSGVRAFNRDRDGAGSRALVDELNSTHTTHILLIAGGREVLELAAATTSIGSTPILLIPGSLATNDLLTLPGTFADRLFVALPSLPSDQTRAGTSEYRALADTYRLPGNQLASQIAALCSAKVLMQALKLAGRTLNRAKLMIALEGLYDFDTGFMPRIGFGPNRRVGALGAYIVTVNPIASNSRRSPGGLVSIENGTLKGTTRMARRLALFSAFWLVLWLAPLKAGPTTSAVETVAPASVVFDLKIPDLPVFDQDGRKLNFYSDLVKGRTVAINFIFTTCTTICPQLTMAMRKTQQQLGARVGRDIWLVSVSVYRATDVPEAAPVRGQVRRRAGMDVRHRTQDGHRSAADGSGEQWKRQRSCDHRSDWQ